MTSRILALELEEANQMKTNATLQRKRNIHENSEIFKMCGCDIVPYDIVSYCTLSFFFGSIAWYYYINTKFVRLPV